MLYLAGHIEHGDWRLCERESPGAEADRWDYYFLIVVVDAVGCGGCG